MLSRQLKTLIPILDELLVPANLLKAVAGPHIDGWFLQGSVDYIEINLILDTAPVDEVRAILDRMVAGGYKPNYWSRWVLRRLDARSAADSAHP